MEIADLALMRSTSFPCIAN